MQRAQNHIATVTGGDEQCIFLQIRQVMFQLHGNHPIVIHFIAQLVPTVQYIGIERVFYFFHGGTAQRFIGGNYRHAIIGVVQSRPHRFADVLQPGFIGAIDNNAQNMAIVLTKGIYRHHSGTGYRFRVAVGAVGQNENGCAQIVCNFGIQVEFIRGINPHKVGTDANHKIGFGFERFVFFDNPVHQIVGVSFCQHFGNFAFGESVSFFVINIQFKVRQKQVYVFVAFSIGGFVYHRAKHANPPARNVSQQHRRYTQRNQRFAHIRLGGGQVN